MAIWMAKTVLPKQWMRLQIWLTAECRESRQHGHDPAQYEAHAVVRDWRLQRLHGSMTGAMKLEEVLTRFAEAPLQESRVKLRRLWSSLAIGRQAGDPRIKQVGRTPEFRLWLASLREDAGCEDPLTKEVPTALL